MTHSCLGNQSHIHSWLVSRSESKQVQEWTQGQKTHKKRTLWVAWHFLAQMMHAEMFKNINSFLLIAPQRRGGFTSQDSGNRRSESLRTLEWEWKSFLCFRGFSLRKSPSAFEDYFLSLREGARQEHSVKMIISLNHSDSKRNSWLLIGTIHLLVHLVEVPLPHRVIFAAVC